MTAPPPATATNAMSIVGGAAPINPKTVLITGVSRGLGKALALELAKRGHTVIGCSRSPEKLSALQSELASASDGRANATKHIVMNVDVVILLKTVHSSFL